MNPNRVLLMQLSEHTSAKGRPYMTGWLGRASVVAFRGEDDKHGNPTWDLFVGEPPPRVEARPERRPQSPDPGDPLANRSARPVKGGSGWRGAFPPTAAGTAPSGLLWPTMGPSSRTGSMTCTGDGTDAMRSAEG